MSEEIERLARATLAQLSAVIGPGPIAGVRAQGTATVKATGADVVLEPMSYALMRVDGTVIERLLVKTMRNPVNEQPHQTGGDWTVTSSGTPVLFIANTGGHEFNTAGKKVELVFDPPLAGVEPTAALVGDFTGGVEGRVKQCAVRDGAVSLRQAFNVGVGAFPAVLLAWVASEGVEGRTAGIGQGRSRKSRNTRAYFERFTIYVVSSSQMGGPRARVGREIMESICDALTDRQRNVDGEQLCTLGNGLEIMSRSKHTEAEQGWIYQIGFRVAATATKQDERTFSPWLLERGRVSHPPTTQNPTELPATDVSAEMPQD